MRITNNFKNAVKTALEDKYKYLVVIKSGKNGNTVLRRLCLELMIDLDVKQEFNLRAKNMLIYVFEPQNCDDITYREMMKKYSPNSKGDK